jgi:hypothetical protein
LGHSQAVVALVLALGCASCAYLPAPLERPFRAPGQHLQQFPEEVAVEYGCAKQKLPWFKIEQREVWPKRVRAGGELGHRLVYALCTAGATEVVTGTLETRIVHRGKPVVRDANQTYDLRPGRWVVDVFVTVPPAAQDGVYALEVEFKSANVHFAQSDTFAVEQAK